MAQPRVEREDALHSREVLTRAHSHGGSCGQDAEKPAPAPGRASRCLTVISRALQCMAMHVKRRIGGPDRGPVEQITVRVPQELVIGLDQVARDLRLNRSQVVRLALESLVNQALGDGDTEAQPIARVRDLLGAVESGIPDLGLRHREYLLAQLRRSREASPARG